MKTMTYKAIYMGGIDPSDFKYEPNEVTYLVSHNLFLQPYSEARRKIGKFVCECGAACEDDTTVMYDIFHTIEKWEPRKIFEENDGSFTLDDETLNIIQLCHVNIYCKKCGEVKVVYSPLDYESQMEIIIANLAKSDIHIDMPCRPRNVADMNLMVTAFNFDHSVNLTDDSEEYYRATDEEYEHDCEDEECDPDECDDTGWKKAWHRYNEKC